MSTSDPKGPAELVPPDQSVLTYAIGELAVYRDLYTLSNAGQLSVNAIIETLRGINAATTKKAVSDAVEKVAYQWVVEDIDPPTTHSTPAGAPPATTDDYAVVSTEIARREVWLTQMSEAQSEIEALLEEVERLTRKNAEKIRYGSAAEVATGRSDSFSLSSRSRRIVAARDSFAILRETAKRELERLCQYKRALEIVRSGCPAGLVGAELPSIPSFSEDDPLLHGEGVVTAMADVAVGLASIDRNAALARISLEVDMSEAEVFIISLFDLFGTGNERLMKGNGRRALNRGSRRVIREAIALFPDVRWKSHIECHNEIVASGRNLNDSGLLESRGCPGDVASVTFIRTEKPLPWPSSLLFTEEESAAFIAQLAQPSQA